jgi:hypothetical protein
MNRNDFRSREFTDHRRYFQIGQSYFGPITKRIKQKPNKNPAYYVDIEEKRRYVVGHTNSPNAIYENGLGAIVEITGFVQKQTGYYAHGVITGVIPNPESQARNQQQPPSPKIIPQEEESEIHKLQQQRHPKPHSFYVKRDERERGY